MAYTKEQRLINSVSGNTKSQRNPSTSKQSIVLGKNVEEKTPMLGGFLPNHSGITSHPEINASLHTDKLAVGDIEVQDMTGIFHLQSDTASVGPLVKTTLANSDAKFVFQNDAQIWQVGVFGTESDSYAIKETATNRLKIATGGDITVTGDVSATADNTNDLGNSSVYWKDLYLKGNLTDGTNTISLQDIADQLTMATMKYAKIDAATSGNNTLVAAVAGKKIRVHSLALIAAGTVNVRLEDGASGTALTGQMNLVSNVGFVLPHNPQGWCETSSNTLLNLELSAAISVDGLLTYTEV